MDSAMEKLPLADPPITREFSPSSDSPNDALLASSQINTDPNVADISGQSIVDDFGLNDEIPPAQDDRHTSPELLDEEMGISDSDNRSPGLSDLESSPPTQQTSQSETSHVQPEHPVPENQTPADSPDVEMLDQPIVDPVSSLNSDVIQQPVFRPEESSDQKDEMRLVTSLNHTASLEDEETLFLSDTPHQAAPDAEVPNDFSAMSMPSIKSEANDMFSDEELMNSLKDFLDKPIKEEPASPRLSPFAPIYPEIPHPTLTGKIVIDLTYDGDDEDSDLCFISSPSQNDLDSDEEDLVRPRMGHNKRRKTAKAIPKRSKTKDHKHVLKSKKPKKASGTKKSPKKLAKLKSGPAINSGVRGIGDLDEIIDYDPIAAHHAEPDWQEASDIEATTKKEQLKKMMDGCPDNGNLRRMQGEKNAINEATKSKNFNGKQVVARNGKWLLKTMKTPLYHHQVLAVAWMINREIGSKDRGHDGGPLGGILADAMGLGKTVQLIALMIANDFGDSFRREGRPTLVILPATIIEQWDDELLEHGGDAACHVLRYKESLRLPYERIMNHNVVLASYWELMNSCPWPDKDFFLALKDKSRGKRSFLEDDDPEPIEAEIKRLLRDNEGGALHHIDWYRVVLDEAHAIKNYMTRGSFAANALKAKYRWAVTGTPIMNHPKEYYSLLRFLKVVPTRNFREFKKRYCNYEDAACNQRLKAFTTKLMFRRTVESKLLGRPIIKLPTPHEHLMPIDFTPQEFILYDAVEECFFLLKDEEIEDDDPRKSFQIKLHQLTRLRH